MQHFSECSSIAVVCVHVRVLYVCLSVCSDALQLLTSAINAPNAKEDTPAINATENAISAVTKVCKYLDTGVPYDSILPMWLSWLPVVEDKEEAPHVYSYLCDMIERYIHVTDSFSLCAVV